MNLLAIGIIPSSGLPVRSQGGNSLTTPTATYFGWYYVLTHSSLLCLVWFLAAGSFRIVFTCDSITLHGCRHYSNDSILRSRKEINPL